MTKFVYDVQRMQTLFLVGPTAVGKSAVSLELARLIGCEIVSADSMQVYRGMDIGTAKPTAAERALVPHHIIDVCDVGDVFDAKRFIELTSKVIADIRSRGKVALVVGGTGLYVRALRHGLFEGPSRNEELRVRLEAMTAPELFEELQRLDPQTAGRIDRHNPRRLVRALEVFHETGKPISELQKEWSVGQASRLSEKTEKKRRDACSTGICLNRTREDLHARIEQRIDQQIAGGWVGEVRRLLALGLEKNPSAMQAAGYRELVAHVRGELSLDKAVALIKTRTRQLAKRQLTWFRREPELQWLEIGRAEQPSETATRVRGIFHQQEKSSAR
jgi:tRNA dimethylallyltransferase